MAILGLNKLFNKKKSISDVDLDELRREKVRLEQDEARFMHKVEDLERQKHELLMRGKDEPSQRKRRVLAAKIKELDVQARNTDKNLQFFAKQQRIINGFLQIKENERILQQSGVLSLVNQLDLQALQTYIEQASTEGAFQLGKFESIIQDLEGRDRVTGPMHDDEDIDDIMELMESMGRADMENPGSVETMGTEGLDRILRPDTEDDVF
jgi:hypothetical protein